MARRRIRRKGIVRKVRLVPVGRNRRTGRTKVLVLPLKKRGRRGRRFKRGRRLRR